MKILKQTIHAQKHDLERHAFLRWLGAPAPASERRFVFGAAAVDFIMGFADLNKWFLPYEVAQVDALQAAINIHTQEDRTHSKLFIEDWHKLGFDQLLPWRPSEALWWSFHRRETEPIRSLAMKILGLVVANPDPALRFAIVECMEEFGDVVFELTEPVAIELEQLRGQEYRYFGSYHRVRETGRLQGVDEDQLMVELDPAVRARAEEIVRELFADFHTVFDMLFEVSTTEIETHTDVLEQLERENQAQLRPADAPALRWPAYPAAAPLPASALPIGVALEARVERMREHGLFEQLSATPMSSLCKRLCSFLPLWSTDVVSYPDFVRHAMSYANPTTAEQHTINRWCRDLAGHARLFINDWCALGIDDTLGFSSGEMICFSFLSPLTELHRHNMASIKKVAFATEDPVLRFWLLYAIERGSEVFFEHTAPLATALEASTGVRLDYLAHRHYRTHVDGVDTSAEVDFLTRALDPERASWVMRAIEMVFDNFEAQLDLSLEACQSEQLLRDPHGSLPMRRAGFTHWRDVA